MVSKKQSKNATEQRTSTLPTCNTFFFYIRGELTQKKLQQW